MSSRIVRELTVFMAPEAHPFPGFIRVGETAMLKITTAKDRFAQIEKWRGYKLISDFSVPFENALRLYMRLNYERYFERCPNHPERIEAQFIGESKEEIKVRARYDCEDWERVIVSKEDFREFFFMDKE